MGREINDIASLPPQERAICYREFAVDAERSAAEAHTATAHDSYLTLAAEWRALADEVDAEELKKLSEGYDRPSRRPHPLGPARH